MGKLILVDGNSLANRAFYALPLLNNKQGIFTNAVYGFTQILLKILEEEKPDKILVAFDAGKQTFRHTDYTEYKGKRLRTPSELSGQFPMLKELLDAFNIRYYEQENYEADDIIGTISKHAEKEQINTIIYTGDKDLLQLVSDKVSVYLTKKGITEIEAFGPKELYDRYQLKPEQIVDLKGLMGDPSDNIPGVPGVGEKTALKLLHQFETIEKLYEHLNEITGKLQEKLSNNKESAYLSKQLATIYREMEISLLLEDLNKSEWDEKKLFELFAKWDFNSLIDRLGIKKEAKIQQKEIEEELSIESVTEQRKNEWNALFQTEKSLAVHFEIKGDSVQQYEIIGLALSNGNRQIFISKEEMINWKQLLDWLADEDKHKLVYDAKKTEVVLFWNHIKIKGIHFDLLLATYLLNPSDGTTTLSDIAKQYEGITLQDDDEIYGKGAKYAIPDLDTVSQHVTKKANIIWSLAPQINEKLKESDLDSLLYELELPLSGVLALMEEEGVGINIERLQEMGIEFENQLSQLTEQIYELAGTEFNINSPKQLGEILFDKLQLPIIKKTKTGYSTNAEVLEKLESQHPIIGLILHFRQLGKLKSTYIEGLLKVVHPVTKKIHTSFNQAITATGRLSSTEPNLQNIPIRLEEGRKIREAFIPSKKDWLILAADYSQIELRVLADISEDKNLIAAFNDGMDIHTKTAMDVFGVKEDDVTSLMRRQAKAVNFGIVYGISDYGLSQNLNISRKEAGEFIERYFSVFAGVKEYMHQIVDQAKKDGYVTTLLNRRRYLPDIYSSNFNIRSFAERTAMNTPIQGTAADIIKLAMIKMDEALKKNELQSKMLLQVHDELIFEVHPEEKEILATLVREVMESALQLKVPLKVDLNIGENWYQAK